MQRTLYHGDIIHFQEKLSPATDSGVMVHRENSNIFPQPYRVLENGSIAFRLYYPNAQKVVIKDYVKEYELVKEGDFWCGECDFGRGFISLFLSVDGNSVLSKYLPIGYGGNEPLNFIEVKEDDFEINAVGCPHGTMHFDYLESRVTNRMERIVIYLPADYYEDESKRYPVLYLQHGHGENEICWMSQGKVNFIYDKLIADGKAVPCIIVMADGMHYRENETERVLEYGKWVEFLTEELISHIDGKYRTFSDKDHRAVAGLSMGSVQASMAAFSHSELFSYVGIFSGFVQNIMENDQNYLTDENIEAFKKNIRLYFRGTGDEESFISRFESDDVFLQKHGIEIENRVYSGGHEWKVWRRCIYDFAQMIFR